MANISYHVDRGDYSAANVTVGTGASTQDIELIVDNAEGVTKKDVLLALKAFEKTIKEDERYAEI